MGKFFRMDILPNNGHFLINFNFVTTERIFKIRNSAESYCLAENNVYRGN